MSVGEYIPLDVRVGGQVWEDMSICDSQQEQPSTTVEYLFLQWFKRFAQIFLSYKYIIALVLRPRSSALSRSPTLASICRWYGTSIRW